MIIAHPTTLFQIFCEFVIHLKVIFKGIINPGTKSYYLKIWISKSILNKFNTKDFNTF